MCDAHGRGDLFTADAVDLTMFEKTNREGWKHENQIPSVFTNMYNFAAPKDALDIIGIINIEMFSMREALKYAAFNYNAPKDSSQRVTMQVVCMKCAKATRAMNPFFYDTAKERYGEMRLDKMKEFADTFNEIIMPSRRRCQTRTHDHRRHRRQSRAHRHRRQRRAHRHSTNISTKT